MALSEKHLDGTGLSQVWGLIKKFFVAKEEGKGLSTNDYTTTEKNKLSGIEEGAQKNVQSDWNESTGDAAIKNKPTTVAGYGITDAYTKIQVDTAVGAKADKASTLEGYGIADAYTKEQANAAIKTAVDTAVAGVYKIKGSVPFASLPTQGMVAGDVYNITDDFTTTEAFVEGAGKECKAGSNVVYTENGWDVMAGTYDFSDFVMKADIQFLTEDEITEICTM